jgi:hypothetical protein
MDADKTEVPGRLNVLNERTELVRDGELTGFEPDIDRAHDEVRAEKLRAELAFFFEK